MRVIATEWRRRRKTRKQKEVCKRRGRTRQSRNRFNCKKDTDRDGDTTRESSKEVREQLEKRRRTFLKKYGNLKKDRGITRKNG